MEIDWIKLANEGLNAASRIGVGLVLAYCGLRIYFRQKEYELVKLRYLEQSLDIVTGELEEVAGVFLNNWARALELVKELRDAPQNFERSHLDQGFLPFRGSNFNIAAHHRLIVLTKSRIFWECYQLALARHSALNAVAAKEIPHAISEYLAGRLEDTKSSNIVDDALKELKPMPAQSDHFAPLQNGLQRIAAELERSKLSFGDIEKFGKRKIVLQVIDEMEKKYGQELHQEESE